MAFRKKKAAKKAAKKKAAAAPAVPTVQYATATIYYRDIDNPRDLYRVITEEAIKTKKGGLNLEKVPAGKVSKWEGVWASPATLPENIKHTKNVAGVGV